MSGVDRVRANLEGISERLAAATPGPWHAVTTGVRGGDHWYVCDDGESLASIACRDGVNEDQREPDARFIAAAPSDVRALTGAVEAVLALADEADAAKRGSLPPSIAKNARAEISTDAIRRAVAAHLDPKKENPNG